MLKNYIKIAFRNILKYKGYSIINISGLSFGLAAFFMIMIFVKDELSYDRHFENAENIYRLCSKIKTSNGLQVTAQSAPGWARHLLADFPEVEKITRLKPPQQWWKVAYETNLFYENKWTFADSSIFEMFDVSLIEGIADEVLSEPYQVILSAEMAEKYFKGGDAIGQTFRLDNQYDFTVSGIFNKLSRNTHFEADFFASFVTLQDSIYGTNLLLVDNFPVAYTYIQLKEGADPADLESKLPQLIEQYIGSAQELADAGFEIEAFLQPINEIHLFSHLENEIQANGFVTTIYIFIAVALFILTVAGINFMNLSTARSVRRALEVGMRKAIGASKGQLISQFISEAMVISIIAYLLSLLIVAISMPAFAIILERKILFSDVFTPIILLALLGFTLIIGFLSGSYPAFYLSSFQPTDVLKGSVFSPGQKASVLRKSLIIFQFTVSIIILIVTGILFSQMKFIEDFDVGIEDEQVIVVQLSDPVLREGYRAFKTRSEQLPRVENVSASFNAPADVANQGFFRPEHADPDEKWMTHFFGIDYDFFETMGIPLLAGRSISHENTADTLGALIINETAVKKFGWQTPEEAIGKQLFADNNPNARPMTIIGVAKDFHMQSVHDEIPPTVMMYFGVQGYFYAYLRIDGETQSTLKDIETAWNDVFVNYPFEYSFLDDDFNGLYTTERILKTLLTYFTILAIIIACLGLYGLASYMVEQRKKEIGVRKVLGASTRMLVFKFSTEYSIIILVAFFIAAPIAYYLMNIWLQTFEYHVAISMLNFILPLIITMVISSLTVAFQVISAAKANPVESLRID